jgi:hypothetical protein
MRLLTRSRTPWSCWPASAALTEAGIGLVRLVGEKPLERFYDQIAWFTDARKGPLLTLDCSNAGNFDFVPHLANGRTKTELSWHVSDHYPMYVEIVLPH